jgi:hypothetical protein
MFQLQCTMDLTNISPELFPDESKQSFCNVYNMQKSCFVRVMFASMRLAHRGARVLRALALTLYTERRIPAKESPDPSP